MRFKLVSKGSEEPIDSITNSQIDIIEAKEFFMANKRLDEKAFDKIFEVKEVKDYHKPPVNYKWWKEETLNPDIEK
tara:strand:- start:429 stop:656 length:228 start_codon:yes stop_codon:yes gene_type:complete